MSQENVEIVPRVSTTRSTGTTWTPRFVTLTQTSRSRSSVDPSLARHRGRETPEAIFTDIRAAFDAWIIEPSEFLESGNQVVAIVKNRLRPKGTDVEFETQNGHLWTIRDGTLLFAGRFPEPR